MADCSGPIVVVLAKDQFGLRERAEGELARAEFVEFSGQTMMSGVNLGSASGGRGGRRLGSGPVDPRGGRLGTG